MTLDDLDQLIQIIDRASKGVMQIYLTKEIKVQTKEDRSALTAADLLSHQIIVESLKVNWPTIPILSEESANEFTPGQSIPLYWAIDPLDGTKEFIKRNDEFTINIALIKDGAPILGLMAAPALSLLFVGWKDHGARLRDKGNWKWLSPLARLNLNHLPKRLRVAVSRSHPSIELDQWLGQLLDYEVIPMGSALKFGLIAQGKVDCYPRFGSTCLWDTAAADAILRSLGGKIVRWPLDEPPQPLEYGYPASSLNPSFIAY